MKSTVPGSLIRAKVVGQKCAGQDFELWGIALGISGDKISVRVVEIVPSNYNSWTQSKTKFRVGAMVDLDESCVLSTIEPTTKAKKRGRSVSFLVKMNRGRIVDIYSTGDQTAHVRFVDLAKAYQSGDKVSVHRDVLITTRGIEELDDIEDK